MITLYVRRITSWLSLSRNYVRFHESCHTGVDNLTLRRFGAYANIHLFSLLDGSPHKIPLKRVIPLNLEQHHFIRQVHHMQISGSRIAFIIETSNLMMTRYHKKLIALDWKTGQAVSNATCGRLI
jgi:hypothetical protein